MVGRKPTPVKHDAAGSPPIDLSSRIIEISEQAGLPRVALSFHDLFDGRRCDYHGDEWFHAASTIKVAIMVALFALEEEGELRLDSGLEVANHFYSLIDGAPFSLDPARDSCPELYQSLGQKVPIHALIRDMIVSSSNLATNVLLELRGAELLQQKLVDLGVGGVELLRGVEDEAAFEQGINNRVTANGLRDLFQLFWQDGGFSPDNRLAMLDILFGQKFADRIPMGLPEEIRDATRFAHKTGEISTVVHDAGLVFLPGRRPYCLVVLTETGGVAERGQAAIQALSSVVYRWLIDHDI